jgi:hypothetical protein
MADDTSLAGWQLRLDRELAAASERLATHFNIAPPDYGPKRMDIRKRNIQRTQGVLDFLNRLAEHVKAPAKAAVVETESATVETVDTATITAPVVPDDPKVPGTGKTLSYFDGMSDEDILNSQEVKVGAGRLKVIHEMREKRGT